MGVDFSSDLRRCAYKDSSCSINFFNLRSKSMFSIGLLRHADLV